MNVDICPSCGDEDIEELRKCDICDEWFSEDELEDLVKCFNKSHKAYAAFVAGVAVAHCSEKWDSCTDLLNASAGAISMFYDLLGIYDPDYIDFEES